MGSKKRGGLRQRGGGHKADPASTRLRVKTHFVQLASLQDANDTSSFLCALIETPAVWRLVNPAPRKLNRGGTRGGGGGGLGSNDRKIKRKVLE